MNPLQQRRSKVNGRFLQQNNGKQISILGEIVKVNPGANTIDIKTTDGCVVNVFMSEPITEAIEGWVEVRGIGQGKTGVRCNHYVPFPDSMFSDFDRQLYDDVITVINTFNNPWVNTD